jgi:hypothetical protein
MPRICLSEADKAVCSSLLSWLVTRVLRSPDASCHVCGAGVALDRGRVFPVVRESLLPAGIMTFWPAVGYSVRVAEAGPARDPEHAREEKRITTRYFSLPQQAKLPESGWCGDSLEPAPDRAGVNWRSAAGRRPGDEKVRIGGAGPPVAQPAEVSVDGGRGWDREVERHWCTSQRIEKLLSDLGQPFGGPGDALPRDLDGPEG